MNVEVRVQHPVAYDTSTVARALGVDPLELSHADRVLAPFVTVNGRIHRPTSDFLRQHCQRNPNLASANRIASDLAAYLRFLINNRQLAPHEGPSDPVLIATETDFAAYYRHRQYGPDSALLTGPGWSKAVSAIKRLHQHLQREYQHPPPFQIITVPIPRRRGGTTTTLAGYAPRQRHTSSAGTPLTPHFAHLLLMGALRVDLNGRQRPYRGADRDHALIALALAAGLRRQNLAYTTIYELPGLTDRPLTLMPVADLITKGGAGGDAIAFSHHLPAVWHYVNGARHDLVTNTQYRPEQPLRILDVDNRSLSYRDDATGEARTRLWRDCPPDVRVRLVDQDGSSPLVFLTEPHGTPLSYSALQHVVAGARRFVINELDESFPARFRLHDLRHTYAVHLTLAIFHGIVAQSLPAHRRDSYIVDNLSAAVDLVRASLGHASEESTQLYISTAHRFLDIDPAQFLGEP